MVGTNKVTPFQPCLFVPDDIRGPPDVILRGSNMDILHRSGRTIEYSVATDFVVQMDPIDWVDKYFFFHIKSRYTAIGIYKPEKIHKCFFL